MKNYEKIKNILTNKLSIDQLIIYIDNKVKESNKFYELDPIIFNSNIIESMKNIYDKYINTNICEFFKELTYKHCELMSLIYEKLFKSLDLELIFGEIMILKL